jgi:drug/metabolite transporter (DMT)-like permease
MSASHRIKANHLALLALLVIIWGSSFALSKIAIHDVDPNWVAALRLIIGGSVIFAIAQWNNQSPLLMQKSWPKYVWLGVIGNAVPFILISWGIQYTSSGVTGLLMGTIPLFVIVIAHFLLPDEKLNWHKAIGFILGFIGVVILMNPRHLMNSSFQGQELWGELAIIFACLCYGIHSVTAKRLGFDKPFQQTAGILMAAAAFALLFAIFKNPHGLETVKFNSALAILGLGVFPTAISMVIVYYLMEHIGPSAVSFTNYLVPVFALLLGAAAFNETLSWNILVALLCILAGIAITSLSRRRF